MPDNTFSFSAPLEHIDEPGGWWYVRLPDEIRDTLKPLTLRGYGKVKAKIGKTAWETSIMPLRKGESMIAIKAEIRKAKNLQLGQVVTVTLVPLNT